MSSGSFGIFDWLALAAYGLAVLWLGFRWSAPREETSGEYFLAGRSLSWAVTGISLFATNMSSSSLIGLIGGAYQMGLAIYNYEWTAVVVLLGFAVFFLPVYRRLGIVTAPEFLERRFDARTRRYFSGLSLVGNVFIDTAATLYAGAVVLRLLVPGISLAGGVALLAVLAGAYAIAGGLRAVAYTDVLQGGMLLLGASIVAFSAYGQAGGWEAVQAATAPNMRRLLLPADSAVMPWPALVTGVPLLGVYYWCVNQTIVQRTLASRSLKDARHGALFAAVFKLPVLFLMVMPGLFALVLYPNLGNPDLAFPRMALDLLPGGVRGFVIAAFAAAIMSSVDSVLNSASTLVTMDFYAAWRPEASEKRLVLVGRLAGMVVLGMSAVIAPLIGQYESLWAYLQTALAYLTPPVVAVFIGGVFWKRANRHGALMALVGGSATAGGLLLSGASLYFLYAAAVVFAVSLLLLGGGSWATAPPPPEKVASCAWRPEDARADPASWGVGALLLLGLALLLACFL